MNEAVLYQHFLKRVKDAKKTVAIFNMALMIVLLFTALQLNAEGSKEKVICPVSGEKILKSDAVGPVTHDGHDY
ncbi:hypothetical protein KAH55_15100 [bacterium]|nr:hypothetical protein [bacterium]